MKKQQNKTDKLVTYTDKQVRCIKDHTNYQHLDKMKDIDIDYSDIPITNKNSWAKAKIIDVGKKKPISLRVDNDVLTWFKKQGGRYQYLMNRVLRKYMDSHQ